MESALQNAFAPSSRKNMALQQQKYLQFCQSIGTNPIPTNETTLCRYAIYLGDRLKSVDSIGGYLQGIKNWMIVQGLPTTAFNSSRLKLVLRGLRRQKQHLPKQALPITPRILMDIRATVSLASQRELVFWTISLLAFFLTSRKSNLVPDVPSGFNPEKNLVREDIRITDDALWVTFRWSKTIQYGQRSLTIPVRDIPGSPLCPRWAYTEMIKRIPARSNQPAFLLRTAQGDLPYSYWDWMRQLKASIAATGRDETKFSTHSFRRGGATFAYDAGVPVEAIKLMGDWASDAVYAYIHVPSRTRWAAANKVSTAIKHCSGF